MTLTDSRKWGAYYPLPKGLVGGSYVYNFGYLEGVQTLRKFDVYSTFLSFSSDYPGNPTPPSTRSQHTDVAAAMAAGHDVLIALDSTTAYMQAADGGYYPVRATGADIRSGTWDSMVGGQFTWILAQAATYNVKVIVRFMWEANLGPNVSYFYPGNPAIAATGTPAAPTGTASLTTTGQPIITTPQDYKDTFAYMSAFLKGLPNGDRIRMFYCPGANDGSAATAAGNTVASMAPALASGDYAGYDTYNTIGGPWYTPAQTLAGPRPSDPTWSNGTGTTCYSILDGIYPSASGVQFAIGEINCMDQQDPLDTTNTAAGNSKPDWYTALFALPDSTLPRMALIAFFDSPGTRKTWPFDSTAAALAAFQLGFAGTAPGGTVTHGIAADPYVPPTGTPPLNVYGVTLPLRENYLPGEPGLNAILNGINYALNRVAQIDPSGWLRGTFSTDATLSNGDTMRAAITALRRAVGETYVSTVDIRGAGGAIRNAISTRLASNSNRNSWELREDGRQAYGDGTNDVDVLTGRVSVNTWGVSAPSPALGNLTVTGAVVPNEVDLLNAASAPAAPGAGGGVKTYSQADSLRVRASGLLYQVKPALTDRTGTGIYPYAAEGATAASSALASGIVYLVRLQGYDSRTLSRVLYNVVTAANTATTGQCFVGIYDSAGNLIGQSADQATTFGSTGFKSVTVTATTSLAVNPSILYAAILSNATTGPTISHAAGIGNTNGTGGATTNYGRFGSGLTALPTTITLSSITADSGNKWIGVQ